MGRPVGIFWIEILFKVLHKCNSFHSPHIFFFNREMLHPQYFYNIFITNHRRLVVISSNLNLTLRLLFCPNQWRLQEFCPRCSYSTLKKFRVISVCFGKYRPKFKIWPAWSLCLKKKKVLKTETNLHFVYRKPQKEKKKWKEKKWTKVPV